MLCTHSYKTVKIEKQVINHPSFGHCRREHRVCKLCGEKLISHLMVDLGELGNIFSLKKDSQ